MRFRYKSSSRVSGKTIRENAALLEPYLKHINMAANTPGYDYNESSINLPLDEELLDDVETLVKEKVTGKIKYIIVVGIGGSNLGTKAIYDALWGYKENLTPEHFPKILFLDTSDDRHTKNLLEFIDKHISGAEELLINVISKSGRTTETIAHASVLFKNLQNRFTSIGDRFVAITNEKSSLWETANRLGISCISIPESVGGRFSVFSAVGLLPLFASCVDIKALRAGANAMRTKCLKEAPEANPALASAVMLFSNYQAGKMIHDTFIFNPQLESLGKWYRQLMGESIGKEKDLDGNKVNIGITPTISIGSADLHSVGQLYLGGPKDKVTTFVSAPPSRDNITIPNNDSFETLVPEIKGKTYEDIMSAILSGVKKAYQDAELPFMEIELSDINEWEIGEFLQFKMIEIMYLGKLLNVNAFNQPSVESYKTETKRILKGR